MHQLAQRHDPKQRYEHRDRSGRLRLATGGNNGGSGKLILQQRGWGVVQPQPDRTR